MFSTSKVLKESIQFTVKKYENVHYTHFFFFTHYVVEGTINYVVQKKTDIIKLAYKQF